MLRCRENVSGHYDSYEKIIKTVKEPGIAANASEQKHFQFEIPTTEKDKSDHDLNFIARSSEAIMNKDPRQAKPTIHKDDDSEEEKEERFKDLCPSWMGQVFQTQYWLKVYVKHDGFFERG